MVESSGRAGLGQRRRGLPIGDDEPLPLERPTRSLEFANTSFSYRRGSPPVMENLSWLVTPGRTVLLGPNGAGKTTLLALGADALQPTSGQVLLGTLNPRNRRDRALFRSAVGWMPQQARAIPGLSAREQVAYAGWLKGLSSNLAWTSALLALRSVDLESRAAEQTTRLSGGQLRRVGLAQAVVHAPQVLLLDEPTAGLDPAQRARFRELLANLPAQAVVVSTHQVDDLSELFDRVVVLLDGRIHYSGSVADFLALAEPGIERPAEAAYARLAASAR
jgi:ABC-2 type transport system ATP-binding protein